MWSNIMEEKARIEMQNSKKGFERMSMHALWREFWWFLIGLPASAQRWPAWLPKLSLSKL